jgi:hypothetical protein
MAKNCIIIKKHGKKLHDNKKYGKNRMIIKTWQKSHDNKKHDF